MTNGTVLITGGGKRVGLAIAKFLAAQGYTIALHYNTSSKSVEEDMVYLKSLNPKSRSYQCDLTDLSATEKLISEVYKNHPDLSVLINNASIYQKFPITETTHERLEEDLKIHYMAPFLLMREFAKHVKKGLVINIVDARTRQNNTGNASYLISKKALAALTEIAALELAPNIRVNAISPGVILAPEGKPADYMEKKAQEIPLKRTGSLEDITGAVSTLLQETYLTGQTLYIDGGMFL